MKTQQSIHTNPIRRLLLLVSAICFLGFTGCSGIDAAAGKGSHNAFIQRLDSQSDEDVVAANRDWNQMK
jgi:hypothetical protein